MADRVSSQTQITLTPDQLAFMQAHHETIERALIAQKLGDDTPLHTIIRSDEFNRVFSDMRWDDAYDRYQDTPQYDASLRIALHEQLAADLKAGRAVLPTSHKDNAVQPKKRLNDEAIAQLGLWRLVQEA